MADNSAALTRARRIDGRVKRARADKALNEMIEAGELISFPALARRAGVSVSLIYADKQLASRVAEARDRQRRVGKGLYAFEWGERVRMRGGDGRRGHVTPPAWRSTRRR